MTVITVYTKEDLLKSYDNMSTVAMKQNKEAKYECT